MVIEPYKTFPTLTTIIVVFHKTLYAYRNIVFIMVFHNNSVISIIYMFATYTFIINKLFTIDNLPFDIGFRSGLGSHCDMTIGILTIKY